MKKKIDVSEEIVRRASAALPAFTDVFDEESFYLFFLGLTIVACVIAIIAAKIFKIEIQDADTMEDPKRR